MRIAILLLAFLLSACVAQDSNGDDPMVSGNNGIVIFGKKSAYTTWVARAIDSEAGVVCYVYTRGGIDCLPLNETRLGE